MIPVGLVRGCEWSGVLVGSLGCRVAVEACKGCPGGRSGCSGVRWVQVGRSVRYAGQICRSDRSVGVGRCVRWEGGRWVGLFEEKVFAYDSPRFDVFGVLG